MILKFDYHSRWCSADNQSVGSSALVVSRWLWPGNRTFSEVASMVVTWWIVAFFAQCWLTQLLQHSANPRFVFVVLLQTQHSGKPFLCEHSHKARPTLSKCSSFLYIFITNKNTAKHLNRDLTDGSVVKVSVSGTWNALFINWRSWVPLGDWTWDA